MNTKAFFACAGFLLVNCNMGSPFGDQASAQTVQLPTFSTSGVGTTVMVPDGGSALLGGVSRSGMQSNSRSVPVIGGIPGVGRLFRNESAGSSFSHSSHRVHVRIHDLDEMDRAVLAEAARRRGATHDVLGRPIDGFVAEGGVAGGSASKSNGVLMLGIEDQSRALNETESHLKATEAESRQRKAAFITRNIGRNE